MPLHSTDKQYVHNNNWFPRERAGATIPRATTTRGASWWWIIHVNCTEGLGRIFAAFSLSLSLVLSKVYHIRTCAELLIQAPRQKEKRRERFERIAPRRRARRSEEEGGGGEGIRDRRSRRQQLTATCGGTWRGAPEFPQQHVCVPLRDFTLNEFRDSRV